ncbi:MAG: HD domain-containing protein [Acidimicrobiia bacterium]
MSISSVDALLDVLGRGAGDTDGEVLDLLAHGLQCAELLAEAAPEDPELQIAGLVHDVGTVLEPGEPATHATTGAAAVAPLLGERVAALVAGHDHAKRYLVTADPAYRSRLSEFSVITLGLQGGEMGESERTEFEAGEHFDALVALRRADDAAKVPGREVPGLDAWRTTLDRLTK